MTGANDELMEVWHPRWYYILVNKSSNKFYFGQSTRSDISNYLGSGIYWRKHCKKHGGYSINNVICVKKWWIDDKDLAELLLEEFEILNPDYWSNKNKKWANMIPETTSNTEFLNLSEEQRKKATENRIKTLSKKALGDMTGFELIGQKIAKSKEKVLDNGLTVGKNAAIKTAQTKSITINELGLNIHQQTGKKSKKTKDKIGDDGLTTHQRVGRKLATEKSNTFDDNGLNIHQIIGKKISTTKNSNEWKNTIGAQTVEKQKRTLSRLEENGRTKAQNQAREGGITQKSEEWKRQNYRKCSHCGIFCSPGNFKRWHDTNCKKK